MKSLKTLLQEVTAGIKAWANANFSLGTHVHGNISNNGKVGTTANKPLITGTSGAVQAGAFGNAANTFCEGNDSRLSDARTPVAHTHVTSEVLKTGSAITGAPQTNFFFKIASWEMSANQYFGAELLVQNSNYAQNRATVTIGIRTSLSYTLATGYLYLSNNLGFDLGQFYICYKEESNKVLFELYCYIPSTWNGLKFSVISECLKKGNLVIELFNTMTVYNRISSDAVADLPAGYTVIEANYLPLSQDIKPSANNTYDLGSSSYQWNNLYAKNYYYNGVAWGLDKANYWSETQIIRQQVVDIVNNPSAKKYGKSLYFSDGTRFWSELRPVWNTDGSFTMELGLSNYSTGGTQGYWNINVNISKDFNTLDFYTSHNNANLGTSTNKWKTLNGVNPGALSLPDSSKYDNVTSQVQPPTGESTINLQGGANTWTASADGYLVYVGRYNHFSQVYLYVAGTYIGAQMSSDANSAPLYRFVSVPVCKNQVVQIQVYGTQFNSVYFYPNLGNV